MTFPVFPTCTTTCSPATPGVPCPTCLDGEYFPCNAAAVCSPPTQIKIPFVGTSLILPDPCCNGLEISLKALHDLLMPVFPLLQIVACGMSLVDVVLGIPGILGPPPSISGVMQLVNDVATFVETCLPLLIGYTPVGMILDLICYIVGLIEYIIGMLQCVIFVLKHLLSLQVDAKLLITSKDEQLQNMGACLNGQMTALQKMLQEVLTAMNCIFLIINSLIKMITGLPPVSTALSAAGVNVSGLCISFQLDGTVGFVQLAEDVQELVDLLNYIVKGTPPTAEPTWPAWPGLVSLCVSQGCPSPTC